MNYEARAYLETVREMERKGVIKTSEPLSDFDIMVEYAIGKIYNNGKDTFTTEDIYHAIVKYCGADALDLE